MDLSSPIHLRATNPEKNIDRGYSLFITPGLFNTETVVISYGKYGKQNQQKIYSFDCKAELARFVKNILHKRFTAFNRIGVNYKIV